MTTTEQAPFLIDPTGREHPLTGETITIGRGVQNDVVITSKRVSREHACVRRDGWRVMLEDLGSTNGTFLNDERVLTPTALQDEDRIKIGDVVLVFHDPDVTYRDTPFPELEVDVAAASCGWIGTWSSFRPRSSRCWPTCMSSGVRSARRTTSATPSGPSTTRASTITRSRTWYAGCAPSSNSIPPTPNCCSRYAAWATNSSLLSYPPAGFKIAERRGRLQPAGG